MTEGRNDYSYAYTDELVEQARQLLVNRVTISPTTAARMVLRDNDLTYTEEIGRWYRNKFQQDTTLVNTVSYKEAVVRELPKAKVYLLTSAQNSTPVSSNILRNMEAYAKEIGAEIGVVASRYRNPSLYNEGLKENYWDKSIEKYLIASRYKLHKNLIIASDVRIPYTTQRPLNTLKRLKGGLSIIGGHPKQDMEAVPTLDGQHGKYVYTTGSITLARNYSDTMTGSIARDSHKLGFLVVEILSEDELMVRNVEADYEGNFIDQEYVVTNGEVKLETDTVDTIVVGDSHIGVHSEYAMRETAKMINRFNPSKVVLHDVLSAESVHYYNRVDPFKRVQMKKDGSLELSKEISMVKGYIVALLNIVDTIIIPSANHHDIIETWLTRGDWKSDVNNAETYLELANLKVKEELPKGIFAHLIDEYFDNDRVVTLSYDESYKVHGVELSQHGNKGLNGARGSSNAYARTGIPHIYAHLHGPHKIGDNLCVGTNSNLRMGYNQGYSNWRHLNGIITKNGKTQYLQII